MLSPQKIRGLPVWFSREGEGYWNPQHGELSPPVGWVFHPSGDAFVTREAKKGLHWVLLKRRERYTETRGILCPEESVRRAEAKALETKGAREAHRMAGRRTRARIEKRYRSELEQAIMSFLSFSAEHTPLAQEIAHGAVAHATLIGSGRVGRARKLLLSQRAEFAARAYIRHKYTNYEALLWDLSGEASWEDDYFDKRDPGYLGVKAEAQEEAKRFLEEHRPGGKHDPKSCIACWSRFSKDP